MADTSCGLCRHYIELGLPYHYEKLGYPDGVTVYGFCAKDVAARGIFFPVYLPESGCCKDFQGLARTRQKGPVCVEQTKMEGV